MPQGNPIAGAAGPLPQFVHGGWQNADRLLKRYQQALKSALDEDVLERIGLRRSAIAAASFFTTESATATMRSIRQQVKAAAAPAVISTWKRW